MSAPIRIALRADAGTKIGTGHFARSSAIADILMKRPMVEVVLVTREEGVALVPAYFPTGIGLVALPQDKSGSASAMGALSARGWTPDVLYLDHYGEVPEWEAEAAEAGVRLLVLDDLDAAEQADVIVRPHEMRPGMGNGIVLRGGAYLPLSHAVTHAPRARPRAGASRLRLNVCFGGSDPSGETAKALEAICDMPQLDVDVVIGPGAKVDPALIASTKQLRHVSLHQAPSQQALAGLMSEADLALGAGGVMLWERLCLGLPSLVIAVADNQRPQIDTMTAAGAIRFLGDSRQVTAETIRRAVTCLAADEPAREAMRRAGSALIDGRGATRLASWLQSLALGIRDVEMKDAQDLLSWRTDEGNMQHNWQGAEKPDLTAHLEWLAGKLADPHCVFRIVTVGDEPAGVVRFDLSDEGRAAALSIYLVPRWRGRKIGLPVYLAAERALRRSHPGVRRILSRIHQDNEASKRLHLDAGFELMPSAERLDWLQAQKPID